MIRLFCIFAGLLLLAAIGAWFADNPGIATVDFAGWRIDTSFAAIAGMAALLALLCASIVWALGLARRHMPLVGTERAIKRQRRGLDALNKSLVALASGDHRMAAKLIKDAEVLLPPQPMVHLIAAEAALRSGDYAAARQRYRALEAAPEARILGLRGLIGDARRVGQAEEALQLARRAFEADARSPWALKTLFALEVEAGNWPQAATILDKVSQQKIMDSEEVARHRAALSYGEAAALELAGDTDSAFKAFERAAKARPGFAPPIVALVRLDRRAGRIKRAEKRLMAAWKQAPHPSLVKAYQDLDVSESRTDWLKRADKLAGQHPGHVDSDLLLADAALDARDSERARPIIERLMASAPDRRSWVLKLRLLTMDGQSTDAAEAALESAKAPPEWVCRDCGTPAHLWAPLCSHCGSFDSLEWAGDAVVTRRSPSDDGPIALIGAGGA